MFDEFSPHPAKPAAFATTRWSVILQMGDGADSGQKEKAFAALCRDYWFPLYAFVRQGGKDREDAEDLTQAFFLHLITKAKLNEISPERGRFRNFLLKSLKRFIVDEWRFEQREKRGGGQVHLSIDIDQFEQRLSFDPDNRTDPESIFDRRWAMTLVDRVYKALANDYREAGKEKLFGHLRSCLIGNAEKTYAELAGICGMSEGGFAMSVHRLRRRFGEEVRHEVAQTVGDPAEVEEELRWLFKVLGEVE